MSLVDDAITVSSVTTSRPRALTFTWAALTVSPPGTGVCWFRISETPRTLTFVFGAIGVGLPMTVTPPTLTRNNSSG